MTESKDKQAKDALVAYAIDPNAFPSLLDASPDELATITLVCSGFSMRAVARILGCDVSTVHYRVTKLDPDKKLRLSKDNRNNVMAAILVSTASESISRITGKKLDKCTAPQLMNISLSAIRIAGELSKTPDVSPDADSALAKLRT